MKKLAIGLGLQAVLVGGYLLVERARAPEAPFASERLDQAAPTLRMERREGPIELASYRDQVVLVHFWATWCVPCREELPTLIDAARATGVPLLAVTDEPWEAIGPFFGGDVPAEVVRDPVGDAARRYGVSGLPDTFVVARGERIEGRMGGPRDWSTRNARTFLQSLDGESPAGVGWRSGSSGHRAPQ